MVLFTPREIIEAIALTIIVGWMFKDYFSPTRVQTPEEIIAKHKTSGYNFESWKFASLLVAPSIILHELGHKFVALGFGLEATFHAAWMWIVLGVIMRLFTGFVFFVPAYVTIAGTAPSWVFALTAAAGPAVNFVLWGVALYAPEIRKSLTGKKRLKQKELLYWALLARINLFLGVFNLIPIPGFDGAQVLFNLLGM